MSDSNFILGMTCTPVRLCFVLNFPQYGLSLSPSLVRLFFHINRRTFCSKIARKKAKNNTMVGKLNICSGFYGSLNISNSKNDKFQIAVLSHILVKFTSGSRKL
jgi:hypothetical protein